ncbi:MULTISPECIES: hypothetical protein [unclassified Providencia]|nr:MULTISPECIES: hypothetical protein [unclassified Providencia]
MTYFRQNKSRCDMSRIKQQLPKKAAAILLPLTIKNKKATSLKVA